MYKTGDQMVIAAENLPEFSALLDRVKDEAEQLNETISQLSHFGFTISFSVNHAGGIEEASSVIRTIPVK